jgi:hypothetical protein
MPAAPDVTTVMIDSFQKHYVLPVGLHLDDTLGDALGLSESGEEFGDHM